MNTEINNGMAEQTTEMLPQTHNEIEGQVTDLTSKLTKQLEVDGADLELITRRIARNKALLEALTGIAATKRSKSAAVSKIEVIRAAIAALPNAKFEQEDVEEEMAKNPTIYNVDVNHNLLNTFLWSMSKKGHFIRTVRKGNQSTPAQYEKVA